MCGEGRGERSQQIEGVDMGEEDGQEGRWFCH